MDVFVIDKGGGICMGKSWDDEATDLFLVVNAPVDWATLWSEPSRFLALQSSCVGVARCQIIPMSMRLISSSSSSATGSRLKCANNLLLTVFHIDSSILHMDRHSSATLPSRADPSVCTPVPSARSTRALSHFSPSGPPSRLHLIAPLMAQMQKFVFYFCG